ncbi:MAG TPA: D-arabinono-1,4-lactone oxidase [Gaiellaceae bacterium]|nr:D-arabinono-1,4-lactone oxidase [Gaiellaceae bacterium]
MRAVKNWAGNIEYSTTRVLRPRSVDEAQELVAQESAMRPLGTRHAFNSIADTDGALVSTEQLDRVVDLSETSVTVEAGLRYGELSSALHEHGVAVANLASLPHISVGGAIATATHGSGVRNQSLAAAVSALELISADGSLHTLRRGDPDFDGAVVGLGALGLVARVTLDVVPAFELRQYVYEGLPDAALDESLDELLAGGYSVSVFTTWAGHTELWVKTIDELDPNEPRFGATAATRALNPVPGAAAENATAQLGERGPSYERLPHFRLGFTPSSGAELQSEYVVPRAHAAEAVQALRALASLVSPLLFISEIRAVAADTLWLSPFYERDSVAFHFTWKPLGPEVHAVLPQIEDALAPFGARPHWGKVFVRLDDVYPKLPAFRELRERLDPTGAFRNDFLARYGM